MCKGKFLLVDFTIEEFQLYSNDIQKKIFIHGTFVFLSKWLKRMAKTKKNWFILLEHGDRLTCPAIPDPHSVISIKLPVLSMLYDPRSVIKLFYPQFPGFLLI